MVILRTVNKREEFKLVGASVPPQIYNYLTLFALARKIPKATILKKLLTDWIHDQKLNEPESVLVKDLAERIKLEWKIREVNEGFLDFSSFLKEIANELAEKGLSEAQINTVLQKLNQNGGEKKNRSRTTK